MFFDSAIDRNGAGMPSRHKVTLKYHDGHGHTWTENGTLDLDLLEGALLTETYNVHHVAKSLREIEKTLKKSKTLGGFVEVATEPRETRKERFRDEAAEQRRQHEVMQQRLREASERQKQTNGDGTGPSPEGG